MTILAVLSFAVAANVLLPALAFWEIIVSGHPVIGVVVASCCAYLFQVVFQLKLLEQIHDQMALEWHHQPTWLMSMFAAQLPSNRRALAARRGKDDEFIEKAKARAKLLQEDFREVIAERGGSVHF